MNDVHRRNLKQSSIGSTPILSLIETGSFNVKFNHIWDLNFSCSKFLNFLKAPPFFRNKLSTGFYVIGFHHYGFYDNCHWYYSYNYPCCYHLHNNFISIIIITILNSSSSHSTSLVKYEIAFLGAKAPLEIALEMTQS